MKTPININLISCHSVRNEFYELASLFEVLLTEICPCSQATDAHTVFERKLGIGSTLHHMARHTYIIFKREFHSSPPYTYSKVCQRRLKISLVMNTDLATDN